MPSMTWTTVRSESRTRSLIRASKNLTNPLDGAAHQTNWPSGGPNHTHKIFSIFANFFGHFWPIGGQLVGWARSSKVKVKFWVTLMHMTGISSLSWPDPISICDLVLISQPMNLPEVSDIARLITINRFQFIKSNPRVCIYNYLPLHLHYRTTWVLVGKSNPRVWYIIISPCTCIIERLECWWAKAIPECDI